jgi:hypothetical protein
VAVNGTAGTITSPSAEQGDQTVTLTAAISKGEAQGTYSISVIVKTTDTVYALADYNALTESVLLNGNTDLAHVIKDLALPTKGANGSTITWTSSYYHIIDKTGKINPAPFAIGAKTVTLTEALTAARNGLSEKPNDSPGHHGSGSAGRKKPGTAPEPSVPGQNDHFRSDTTGIYRFNGNSAYYYKIQTPDTFPPTASSSNPQAAAVEFAQKLPDGYLFKVVNLGPGEAVITTRAGDGTAVSFTVEGSSTGVGAVSDTPSPHTMAEGDTYQFKFTLPSERQRPLLRWETAHFSGPPRFEKSEMFII